MSLRLFALAGLFLFAAAVVWLYLPSEPVSRYSVPPKTAENGYVDAAACIPCHAQIYETYRHTGMARSFFRPDPGKMIEDWKRRNTFYHPASDRHYRMFERDGKYYQRRHQIGLDGRETNVVEKEIHFVLGSGNHARTYLNRSQDGKIVELPVAWYSDQGGFWAMNPGFDRPDHDGFRRRITYACMFCHNAYPEIEPGSDRFGRDSVFAGNIPEGIDCQRCHGPGRNHLRAVQLRSATTEQIRSTIVNPARLDSDRQMDVCMQCHLETTSARLPNFIRRYERGAFSFRPGERLGDYMLHFDHTPGTGHDDKFEIVNAAYRLRKSACFQKSGGDLTCITCHDPHDIPRGEEADRHYVSVCQSCHAIDLKKLIVAGGHIPSDDCLGCHMPKRRTDDVVHVVMTDHFIQRFRPKRDLLAPLREEIPRYRAEVALYYPKETSAEIELYLAVAQVKENANLEEGIRRLEALIARHQPTRAEFYFELAEAYFEKKEAEKAIPWYQEALRRQPDLWPAQHKLGVALAQSGQLDRAAEALQKAVNIKGDTAISLNDLGLVYQRQGKLEKATGVFRRATELDPDFPQAYSNLGGVLVERGDHAGAQAALREAIRARPDFSAAHYTLAYLLGAAGDFSGARYHFEKVVKRSSDPGLKQKAREALEAFR